MKKKTVFIVCAISISLLLLSSAPILANTENRAEIADFQPVIAENAEWDWAACAQMMTDQRARCEGNLSQNYDYIDALYEITGDTQNTRASVGETAAAANWLYSENTSSEGALYHVGIDQSLYTEEDFYQITSSNQAVMILLSEPAEENTLSQARYVLVIGADTTNHQLKVYDPVSNKQNWVSSNLIFNGGYIMGSNIKYTSHVN